MQRILSFVLFLFIGVSVFAQPAIERRTASAAIVLPSADLGITKVSIPKGPSFVMTVTNYGPGTAPGPIVITDSMPAPARFPAQAIPAPWTCTPALPSSNVTCTHPGPLTPGNSVVLQLRYTADNSPTDFLNCASVETGASLDRDAANNRDCACVDVTRCRDITIDLTTGRENGATLAANVADADWMYVPTTGTPIASTTASWPWTPATGLPGRFVNPGAAPGGQAGSYASGQHVYRNQFTLAGTWGAEQCRLSVRMGADNSVALELDGVPIPGAATPAANTNSSAAWTQLTSVAIPIGPGAHVLTAKVQNQSSYTGLYVTGEVVCRCASNY